MTRNELVEMLEKNFAPDEKIVFGAEGRDPTLGPYVFLTENAAVRERAVCGSAKTKALFIR